MADVKLTGELSMDTSQGEASVDKFGKSANRMAREVEQSAGKAGAAVGKIGDGAEKSGVQFSRQERSITESVKRATTQLELLGKTASQKLEFKISTQGLDAAKFEPALQKLRELEAQAARAGAAGTKSLDNMGMSAKATSAALRNVPAQFTDIVVSLQGGQAPLTVLLQQGGQLKDMFGGIGPAFKALGGYVLSIVNPFTVAAAGVAAFGFAMASLNNKDSALLVLSTQLAGTGRASVAAVGDIKLLIKELNGVAGVSKASATAILAEFAKVSDLGGAMFRGLGSSVADFAAATGTDLPSAARKLAEAFADPAKGVKALEDSLGTLTAAQILTIEKMAEMGDKSGAQVAMMEALKIATQGLAEQAMTPLGKATEGLSNAWDGLTGAMGKSDTLHAANRILASMIDTAATLAVKLSQLKLPDFLRNQFSGGLNGMVYSAITGGAQQGVTGTWNEGGAGGSFAPTASETDKQIKAALDATKAYGTQASAMTALKGVAKQAKDALKELESQNKGTGIEATTLRDRIAGVNDKLKEMAKRAAGPAPKAVSIAGESEVAGIRARIVAGEAYIQSMKAEGLAGKELNEGEKLAIRIQKELEGGLKGVALANKQKALTAAQSLAAVLRESDALKESLKSQQDFEKLRDKEIAGQEASILKMEEKALAMEDQVRMYSMGKEAIEALNIARLQEQIDILAGFGNSAEQIALIEKEIDARKRLAAATDAKDGLDAGVKAAKAADAEWKKTAASIENTLTDSLMRAFEGGKGFAQAMKDTIVNMFKTMVLRPIVSAVMSPVSAAIGGTLGMTGAANAAEGGSNLLSNASSLNSLYSAGSQALFGASVGASTASLAAANTVGMLGGDAIGTLIAANGAWAGVAAGATSAATATAAIAANVAMVAGEGVALAAGTTAAAAAAAGGTAAAGGAAATGVLAAMGPAGWIALAAVAAYAIFGGSDKKPTASTGDSSLGFDANGQELSRLGVDAYRYKALASADADNVVRGMRDSYMAATKSLGIEASASAFSYNANTGKNGEKPNFAVTGGVGGSRYDSGEVSATKEALSLQASRVLLTALQGSELPKYLAGVFDGLTASAMTQEQIEYVLQGAQAFATLHKQLQALPFQNLTDLSFSATKALIAASGGLEQLGTNLTAYYEGFYSAEEKRAQTIKSINEATAGSGLDAATATEEAFRAMVQGQDLATEAGVKNTASLLGVAGAFYALGEKLRTLKQETQGLEIGLLRASGNTAGADAAQYAVDTKGLTAAEKAIFDYNDSLKKQIVVAESLMKLIDQSKEKQIALLRAQGDTAGADAAQRAIDIKTFGAAEAAAYDYNAALQKQIEVTTSLASMTAAAADLQVELMRAQGDAAGADAAQRLIAIKNYSAAEISAYDYNAALKSQVSALSNATAAMKALQSDANSLQVQLLTAQGNTAGALALSREQQLAGAIPVGSTPAQIAAITAAQKANFALEDQITALNAQAAANAAAAAEADRAASAAESLKSAWQSVTDTIFDEVRRIRGLVDGEGAMGYAQAQSQFAITTAQARAGSQDAAKLLPGLSQALLTLAEANATSLIELQIIRAQTAGSLSATGGALASRQGLNIPSFDVGTNYVQRDMLAQIHEGEAIVPRAYNPAAGGSDKGNAELLAEIRQLNARIARMESHAEKTRASSELTARVLDDASRGKQPLTMETA